MVRIGDDHRAGTAAIGGVHQRSAVARVLYDAFDRGRFRAHDRNQAVRTHHVAEANVDQFHACCLPLFDVLDLFTDFFDIALDVDNHLRDCDILRLGTDGVGFAVHLLHKEI